MPGPFHEAGLLESTVDWKFLRAWWKPVRAREMGGKIWKSGRRPADRSLWTFGEILGWHLFENGTCPKGSPNLPGRRWAPKSFAHAVGSVERSVRNWLTGRNIPNELNSIEHALFADNQAYADWRYELRRAFTQPRKRRNSRRGASLDWMPVSGLAAFHIGKFPIFAGRENEIGALINRLSDPSLRFVKWSEVPEPGSPGSVYAGLLQVLAKEEPWILLTFKPTFVTNNPFAPELASKLAPALPRNISRRPADLAETLFREPKRISNYIEEILSGRSDETELMLFVDQFEELFAPDTDRYRDGFIELLVEAADNGHVRILTTLRAEFLPQCLEINLEVYFRNPGAIFSPAIRAARQRRYQT